MSTIHSGSVGSVAQLALYRNERLAASAMERLSSGLAVNSARDDAVGASRLSLLARERRALGQAIENTQSAISMAQTVDQSLASISEQIGRLQTLALQARQPLLSDAMRESLDLEFQAMRAEVARSVESANWAGEPLLTGAAGDAVGNLPVRNLTSAPLFASSILEPVHTISVSGGNLLQSNVSERFIGPGRFLTTGELSFDIAANGMVTAVFNPSRGDPVALTVSANLSQGRLVIQAADGDNSQILEGSLSYRFQDINQDPISVSGEAVSLSVTIEPSLKTPTQSDLLLNGHPIGGPQPSDDLLSPRENAGASAISRAAVINRAAKDTGVRATVNENVLTGRAMDTRAQMSGLIEINGVSTRSIQTVANNPDETRRRVLFAINAISEETGVIAVSAGRTDQGVTLIARDGRNIEVNFQTEAETLRFEQATGVRSGVQAASITLETSRAGEITLEESYAGSLERLGLEPGTFGGTSVHSVTASRPEVLPAQPQVTSLRVTGTVRYGSNTSIAINGIRVTTDNTVRRHPQDVRDDLIRAINQRSAALGVTAAKGGSEEELLITATRGGVPFDLTIPSQSQTAELVGKTLDSSIAVNPDRLSETSLVINGVAIRESRPGDDQVSSAVANTSDPGASAIAIAAAINESTLLTGVRATSAPAEIQGLLTDTFSLETGTYSLWLNGVEVRVELIQSEPIAQRLTRIAEAIEVDYGRHGVVAIPTGEALTLRTPDGRNLSAWYDKTITGMSAAAFGLDGADGVAQVTKVTLQSIPVENPQATAGGSTGAQFYHYGRSTERLVMPNTSQNGIEVRDGQIYKLLSGEWVRVGSVNSQNLTGAPINANLVTNFGASTNFAGYQGSTSAGGWTVVADPMVPGDPARGVIQLPLFGGGTYPWAVPLDSSLPAAGQGAPIDQGFSTQLYVPSPNRYGYGDGEFRLITSNVPYGDDFTAEQVVKGPYMVTSGAVPFDQGAGNTVSFRWKADSTGDTYDVSAYLVDPDTGHSIQVLNASGSSSGQDQAWTTASATVDRPGRYHLVIIGGSLDINGQAGGQTIVSIDNLTHTSSVRLSNSDVSTMKSWITYTDSLGIDLGVNGVNFQRTPSTPALTIAGLATDIQAAIDDGRLSNLAVAFSGDSLTLSSTRPGVPFTITQASIGGDDGLSISTEELASNQPDSGAVRGVARPADGSIDAVTKYGGLLLSAVEGEKRFSVTVGTEGFGDDSHFYRLGFHAGQFGGPTADARLSAESARFKFQVGTLDGDVIFLDVPNLTAPSSQFAQLIHLESPALGLRSEAQAQDTQQALMGAQSELLQRRAEVGSFMNRLELQVGRLSEQSLEISRQQSVTGDLDYGVEATTLATTQIRQQASTAVLAQSNVNLRKALDLLR